MLNHGVVLRSKNCRLRPMLESDEEKVLELWNQDFVIGNLFMSKTSTEVYRRYFEKYKGNPDEWRWVVEEDEGRFVGTISLERSPNADGIAGGFALYPTSCFLAVVPNILMLDFAFQELKMHRVNFTINANNNKIRKFHKLLQAINTGTCTKKIGSNGKEIVLEHWYYDCRAWLDAMAEHAALCT